MISNKTQDSYALIMARHSLLVTFVILLALCGALIHPDIHPDRYAYVCGLSNATNATILDPIRIPTSIFFQLSYISNPSSLHLFKVHSTHICLIISTTCNVPVVPIIFRQICFNISAPRTVPTQTTSFLSPPKQSIHLRLTSH